MDLRFSAPQRATEDYSQSHLDLSYAKQARPPRRFQHGNPFINYEFIMWAVFGTIATLAVVDRFTWNVWPRETYSIGSGSAGSDFVDGLKDGPWAVKAYDAIARISGRYSIIALNLLTFTMSHTFMAWFSESWLARHVLDMRDYVEANRRLHKWNGILIVIMTLLHVWSIVFPSIFHGWHTQVVLGSFEWILSERGPPEFKDINVETQTMSLQGDDVFRIVEMTLLLGILLPLSIRWLSTRWHLGIQIHSLINVLYFIDIVRRHTHPHSWILNTPFFVLWVLDLLIGVYWRRARPNTILRKSLSEDYILLFLTTSHISATIGPKVYLKLRQSSTLERAHVFTAFQNRVALPLAESHEWNVCVLLRVYHTRRTPRLGRIDHVSHTQRIAENVDLDLHVWGPFNGGMSEATRTALESGTRSVTLVGGGSAAGFLLDAAQLHDKGHAPLTIVYTARDAALLEWVVLSLRMILRRMPGSSFRAVLALTSGGVTHDSVGASVVRKMVREEEQENEGSDGGSYDAGLRIRVQYGRLNFAKLIENGSVVFFQGSGGLQKAVERGVKGKKCRIIAGPAYDNEKACVGWWGKVKQKFRRGDQGV